MDRWNNLGIRRSELSFALTQRHIVASAVKEDACMLCLRASVNDAGLCRVCMALLSSEELELARRWVYNVDP